MTKKNTFSLAIVAGILLALVTIATSFLAYKSWYSQRLLSSQAISQRKLELMGDLRTQIMDMQSQELGFAISRRVQQHNKYEQTRNSVLEKINEYAQLGEKDIGSHLTELLNKFDASMGVIQGGMRDENRNPAIAKFRNEAIPVMDEMNQITLGILTDLEKTVKANRLILRQNNKTNLVIGSSIGIMNCLFIMVLFFAMRANRRMVAIIEENNLTLEKKVQDRTAELNKKTNDILTMFQNMDLGICTLVDGNFIHPEYSQQLLKIFEKTDIAGKNVMDVIFSKAELSEDIKNRIEVSLTSIIGEDKIAYDLNAHLLIHTIVFKSDKNLKKLLELNWSPILNQDGVVEKILLMVKDVTDIRKLEIESAQQKEELDMIVHLVKMPSEKFSDFVYSTEKFVEENKRLIKDVNEKSKDVIDALFRNMHTIKGNARTYELSLITEASHIAEQRYEQLRSGYSINQIDAHSLNEDLIIIQKALARYIDMNENVLGRRKIEGRINHEGYWVNKELVKKIKKQFDALMKKYDDLSGLAVWIKQLGVVSIKCLLAKIDNDIALIAKSLNKPIPTLAFVGKPIGFEEKFSRVLENAFIHIVRNSLDHGIEASNERAVIGKSPEGKITITYIGDNGKHHLLISDDGRGLDLKKLYEKGLGKGLVQADSCSLNEIANLIFEPGLSTAEIVSDISGRGVGMDAVKVFLKEQGADIEVVLDDSNQQIGFADFKLLIQIPDDLMIVDEAIN